MRLHDMVRLMGENTDRRKHISIGLAVALVAMAGVALVPGVADAIHFYRGGQGFGCEPADGPISDDDSTPEDADVVVQLLHNTFHDGETLAPVTFIEVGDTVTWTWNSEHCHSVTAMDGSFDSGFVYPAQEPDTPEVAPGLADYPVPTLEDTTLSYSHTFEEPGTYHYVCVHHGTIGMQGVVVVEEA